MFICLNPDREFNAPSPRHLDRISAVGSQLSSIAALKKKPESHKSITASSPPSCTHLKASTPQTTARISKLIFTVSSSFPGDSFSTGFIVSSSSNRPDLITVPGRRRPHPPASSSSSGVVLIAGEPVFIVFNQRIAGSIFIHEHPFPRFFPTGCISERTAPRHLITVPGRRRPHHRQLPHPSFIPSSGSLFITSSSSSKSDPPSSRPHLRTDSGVVFIVSGSVFFSDRFHRRKNGKEQIFPNSNPVFIASIFDSNPNQNRKREGFKSL